MNYDFEVFYVFVCRPYPIKPSVYKVSTMQKLPKNDARYRILLFHSRKDFGMFVSSTHSSKLGFFKFRLSVLCVIVETSHYRYQFRDVGKTRIHNLSITNVSQILTIPLQSPWSFD